MTTNNKKRGQILKERRQDKYDTKWQEMFDELVEYRGKNGDCNVRQRAGKLGKWVMNQRSRYKEGKLDDDRVQKLERIGFK